MNKDQLLGEVEDVLRTMPPRPTIRHATSENYAWFGRAAAVIGQWQGSRGDEATRYLTVIFSDNGRQAGHTVDLFLVLLNQARAALRLEVGPLSVVIQSGNVFDYFNELRKVIETARAEVFFVDPYLTAEFVAQYLASVVSGVSVRLLGRKGMAALLPAVDLFAQ